MEKVQVGFNIKAKATEKLATEDESEYERGSVSFRKQKKWKQVWIKKNIRKIKFNSFDIKLTMQVKGQHLNQKNCRRFILMN